MVEYKVELPDFDEIYDLLDELKQKSLKLEGLKLKLENERATINRLVTSSEKYYVNGKPPSQDFIKNTYFMSGLEGELMPLREEIMRLEIDIEYAKKTYDLTKVQVDIWRTQSANSRKVIL